MTRSVMIARMRNAFIEHHHDVAAQSELHVDGRFRREHMRIAVQMRMKQHSFFRDLPQAVQAEYLKARPNRSESPAATP